MSEVYIQTSDGVFHPNGEGHHLSINMIAASLSKLCRFNGHTKRFYSVAEHSVRLAWAAKERCYGDDIQREALFHDAHEVLCSDMASPLKKILPDYVELEKKCSDAVRKRLRLPLELSPIVKELDCEFVNGEADVLLGGRLGALWPPQKPYKFISPKSLGWPPDTAYDFFMEEAERLEVY